MAGAIGPYAMLPSPLLSVPVAPWPTATGRTGTFWLSPVLLSVAAAIVCHFFATFVRRVAVAAPIL